MRIQGQKVAFDPKYFWYFIKNSRRRGPTGPSSLAPAPTTKWIFLHAQKLKNKYSD